VVESFRLVLPKRQRFVFGRGKVIWVDGGRRRRRIEPRGEEEEDSVVSPDPGASPVGVCANLESIPT